MTQTSTPWRGRHRRWLPTTALLLSVLCSACTSNAGKVSAGSTATPSPKHSHTTMTMPHMAQTAAGHNAADVRLLLEQVLGHHAILMVRLMRGPIDKEPGFVAAADGALARNTDELVGAVSSVYGKSAGAEFRALWNEHVAALKSYSKALADGDDGAKKKAMDTLDAYAAKYGAAVSKLTQGRLTASAVAAGVAEHIHHLVAATDAYAAKDYEQAYAMERMAYAGMFSTGKALAGAATASSSGELPAGFDNPPAQLRSALGRLLGEHVELAFDTTRAIVSGNPSADAAAHALDGNTQDIIAAMRSVLGASTAAKFSDVWAGHIDALVAFAVAVADKDAAAQTAARTRLDHFPHQLGDVLPSVSHGAVSAQTVIDALHEHDQQLLQQVTSYAAGDYATSHEIAYEGYVHMHDIAATLADVLEGRAAGDSPRGGAATGGGWLARR
jgi:hypothetical protein